MREPSTGESSPSIEQVQAAVLEYLESGKVDLAQKAFTESGFTKEIFHTPEMMKAEEAIIAHHIAWYAGSIAKDIIEFLEMPPDAAHASIISGIAAAAESGDMDALERLSEEFPPSANQLHDPRVLEAARRGIQTLILKGHSKQNVRERYLSIFGAGADIGS